MFNLDAITNKNNKNENARVKNYNDATACIEYFNAMDEVYSNIDDYNPKRKRKI